MLELPSPTRIEVGVDEAGRGPLFGPVVVAAVIMPSSYPDTDEMVKKIKDSKKCTKKLLKELEAYIKETAIAYAIGIAEVEEIDRCNILNATINAMHRALDEIYPKTKFNYIAVDGDRFKPYLPVDSTWIEHCCCIDGDGTHLHIAAASILAKTARDKLIETMVDNDPTLDERYSLRSNKGYGTKKHIDGLKAYGATRHHRNSFAPVKNLK
jgi:ribonuclease HII